MVRKRTVTFSEGLNVLGFDDNGSNSAQESSPDQQSDDSSDDFLANELRTSKKMAQRMVSHVRMAPEDLLEQGHLINRKILTQQIQN